MNTRLKSHPPHSKIENDAPRRSPWRQRLVEAERGMSQGLRGDSTFFVHFFLASILIASAVVIGISLMQWTVLILAATLVLTAEMFNQVLKAIWSTLGHHFNEAAQKSLRIGTAAVFVTTVGAIAVIALIFGQRLWELFSSM